MASTSLSDVSAALSLIYGSRLQTQINSVVTLPFLLPVLPGEGKSLNWTAEFSGAADAVASAEGVARSSADADAETEVPATLAWAQYDKVASVTGLAQAAAGSNFNPESIGSQGRDLLLGRVGRQNRRIAFGVARDLYSGNPGATPTEIAGAELAIDSSGIFASIDPGTYTEWVSAENSEPLANLSFQVVREKLLTPIYDACGEVPEFMTAPSDIFDKLKGLYNDNELHVREFMVGRGGGADGMAPRVVKLSAGMDAIQIDGVPVVRDRFCTASTIYGWNTNYVSLRQLPSMASALQSGGADAIQEFFRRISGNAHLVLPREELEGMAARGSGVMPHLRILGDRGDSSEVMVLCYLQAEWERRNAFGKLLLT